MWCPKRFFSTTRGLLGVEKLFDIGNFNPWRNHLNNVFNRVDEKVVKKIGPHRATAQWILRLGGSVRLASSGDRWITDYNRLPRDVKVTAFDAEGTEIIDAGLAHVALLDEPLEYISLSGCKLIGNGAVSQIARTGCVELDLSNTRVTDVALEELENMTDLKILRMGGTKVENIENFISQLSPRCVVTFPRSSP